MDGKYLDFDETNSAHGEQDLANPG